MSRTDAGQGRPAWPEAVADDAEIAMRALRFLSDANRLRLLTCLADQEACVIDLTEHLDLPQPLVSYHLKRLREAGLVRSQRRAHRVYYAIDPAAWDSFTRPIREVFTSVGGIADDVAPNVVIRPGANDRA